MPNNAWVPTEVGEPWLPDRRELQSLSGWLADPINFTGIIRPRTWTAWKVTGDIGLSSRQFSRLLEPLATHGIAEIVLTSEFELYAAGPTIGGLWWKNLAATSGRSSYAHAMIRFFFLEDPSRTRGTDPRTLGSYGSSWPIPFRIIINPHLIDLLVFQDDAEQRSIKIATRDNIGATQRNVCVTWSQSDRLFTTRDGTVSTERSDNWNCDCVHFGRAITYTNEGRWNNAVRASRCSHIDLLKLLRQGPRIVKPRASIVGGRLIVLEEEI